MGLKQFIGSLFGFNPDIRNGVGVFPFSGVSRANKSNVVVTAETALKISAFYSCVRNISEDIAKLPINIFKIDENGNRVKDTSHVVYNLLNKKPNEYSQPFTLIQTLLDSALRKGNGMALIQRDANFKPVALHFIPSENVVLKIDKETKKIFYVINDVELGISQTYDTFDVLHIRGMGGRFMGISVLDYAAESVGKAIATQEYAGEFFGSGANMTGMLTFAGVEDENQLQKSKEAFMRTYQKDGIAATNGSTQFTKIAFSADEAQMLGALAETVKDIARWFRMPLSKLQTNESISNIEQLSIEYVTDCLEPWITRLEQEIKSKLFTEKEKPVTDVNIDTFMLLKGDMAAMERRIKTMFFVGGASANDALRMMGMNTIGSDGDKYFVPVNMIPTTSVETFWDSKNANNIPTQSPDTTGSGATNANINGE